MQKRKDFYTIKKNALKELISRKREEHKNRYERQFSGNFRRNEIYFDSLSDRRREFEKTDLDFIRDVDGNVLNEEGKE